MDTLFGRKKRSRQLAEPAEPRRLTALHDTNARSPPTDGGTWNPASAGSVRVVNAAGDAGTSAVPSASSPQSGGASSPASARAQLYANTAVTSAKRATAAAPRDMGAQELRETLKGRLAELRSTRPPDDDVDRMFTDLMGRRDLLASPTETSAESAAAGASKNMANFPIEKKWTLVYNDLLTEANADRERERSRRHYLGAPGGTAAGSGPSAMVLMRNSPEWFIKKFVDGTVTTKHIESLAVTLRTCAIGWLQSFVDAKGTPVLASFLSGLHSRTQPSEHELALEYEVLKAFRSLFNSKPGAHDALQHAKCISGITYSLVSPQLATRKQAADILLFLCHWEKPQGHRLVLQGIDDLRAARNAPGRFDVWFGALETVLDGRGLMGSLVGASDEVRRLQLASTSESGLTEYVVNNMFLINAIVNSDIVPTLGVRVHLRNQMAASGLQRLMPKMRSLMAPDLDMQIDVYERAASADQEDIAEAFQRDAMANMGDPREVLDVLLNKLEGSRARDFFVSVLQHLLLIQNDGGDLVHYYQLIDSMVSTVVLDRDGGAAEGGDMTSLLGVSVNNVLSRFADQDLLDRVQTELQEVRAELQRRELDNARLQSLVDESAGGLVGKLQEQVRQLQQDLTVARDNGAALQQDLEEMERTYVDRILNLELELRESADRVAQLEQQATSEDLMAHAQFDRETLRDSLERQVERSRTIRKLVSMPGRHEALPPLLAPRPPPPGGARAPRPPEAAADVSADTLIGRAVLRDESSSAAGSPQPASAATMPSASESEATSLEETNEWSLNATLAAGMAKNTDLQERMMDVRASRMRRRPSAGGRGDEEPEAGPSAPHTAAREPEGPPEPPSEGASEAAYPAASPIPPVPAPPPPPGPSMQATLAEALRARQKPEEGGERSSILGVRSSYQTDHLAPAGPVQAPPAPPNRAMAAPNMRKEVQDMARGRMKQLQWDKLSAQHAAETIWGSETMDEETLRATISAQGVFDEMESDFRAKELPKRGAHAVRKDRQDLQTHLNLATRQGIEMVLKRIRSRLTDSKHSAPEEVAQLIITCDPQIFDQSFLTELLRYYPESEIKGRLGEYKNASDEQLRLLHPADRLVVLLMTVPHLKDKVKGLLYRTKYAETFELVDSGLAKIRRGCDAVMHAPLFTKLLSLILMFGNYLNATGIKGGAFGFRISSINKLVDTKAADGTTLLHFVERTVTRCFPELDGFLEELKEATEACRVQLLDLKRDVAELKSGSAQHKKELDRLLGEHEENLRDPYAQLMLPFLSRVTTEISRLQDQVQLTERTLHDTLRFYGEGPDPMRRGFPAPQPMPTEEFFGIFKEFVAAYRKAKVDNARIAEQRSIESARRAAAEERERERREAQARKQAGIDDNAVLESLLGSLRQSGGTPGRQRRHTRRRRRTTQPREARAEPPLAAPENPSSVAAAMLAKLQGSGAEPGASEASAAAQATAAARADRRRERRERNSVPVLGDLPRPPSSQSGSSDALDDAEMPADDAPSDGPADDAPDAPTDASDEEPFVEANESFSSMVSAPLPVPPTKAAARLGAASAPATPRAPQRALSDATPRAAPPEVFQSPETHTSPTPVERRGMGPRPLALADDATPPPKSPARALTSPRM